MFFLMFHSHFSQVSVLDGEVDASEQKSEHLEAIQSPGTVRTGVL